MNAQNKCCYEFGSFRLDTAELTLFHKGQVVHLTPKAFDTLLVLVENHGHLVEKDELLEKVWEGSFVEEANVAKHISMLRKVLSGNGLKEPFIETIPTRGYRFVAPLTETEFETPQETAVDVEPPSEYEDPDRAKLPRSSRKKRMVPILSVGIIAVVAVLAIGAWYYLPSVTEGDGTTIESTQVSLSTGFERAKAVTISPDGKLVAFTRSIKEGEKPKLSVRRLATLETIDLVSDLQHDTSLPVFSPDSKFIYYFLHVDEKRAHPLYRVSVYGGPVEKVIDGGHIGWGKVAVSPDGNQLAFVRYYQQETEAKIIVVDKDGNNQKEIYTTKRILGNRNQVLWSGDGQRLLFWERIKDGVPSAKWVNKDDKTVSEAKELKSLHEQNWLVVGTGNLVLLKDGSGFLFAGKKKSSDHWQIFHFRTIDGKITQITPNGPGNCCRFSVSDDGKAIAFHRFGRDRIYNMVSYDPVTKESRQIMNDNSTFVPWWGGFSQMPDGKILFSNSTETGADIYSMNKDGGNETRLTSDAGENLNPVGTPDGKYIVFKSNRSGASNLWRMDADGSNPVRLTNYSQKELVGMRGRDLPNRSIQITNDGKTVFFAQLPNRHGKSKLMKIPINGGEPTQLLPKSQTSNVYPYISPDGGKLAYIGFVFDSKTSQNKFTTYIHSLEGDRVGELKKKFEQSRRPNWTAERPKWTPDGKALTYLDQNLNIWKRDIETGKQTAITSFKSETDQVMMFNWSNDGKKVFIVRWKNRFGGDIRLIRNRDISKKLY